MSKVIRILIAAGLITALSAQMHAPLDNRGGGGGNTVLRGFLLSFDSSGGLLVYDASNNLLTYRN